jgi:two-component system osmolarity sensor histidine kinase EnvZ
MKTALRYYLLPRGLLGRSLMIVALPILLLQVIAAFIFFDRHWDSISDRLVFALSGEIRFLSQEMRKDMPDDVLVALIAEAYRSTDLQITVEKIGPGFDVPMGKPYDRFTWFRAGEKLHNALTERLGLPFRIQSYSEDRWFEVIVKLDDQRIARFLCPDRRLVSPTTYIFILWLVASAAILFGIAIIFMRNQVRPIMRLAIAAEKLGKGQDVPDFKPVGASEVRQAARAFMEMKERLKRQIEQRTAMLAGVSHDLRTPLTRMKLQLALMKQDSDTESMSQDLIEMEKMVEGYLTFARGEGDETPQSVDMKVMLDRIVAKVRRQGAVVEWQKPLQPQYLKARPVALDRAISNLIANAAKYAKNIWIVMHADEKFLFLTVDDDGPGIPPHLREDVFKPFYRVEKSRNAKTGGTGLGLSIAQDIIHAHGGEIELQDSPKRGLRVIVRLPL